MNLSRRKLRVGFSGLLATLLALSLAEFVASFFSPRPGPVFAVANRVIDSAPVWFVNFGKGLFGLNDKPALVLGTVILSGVVGVAFALTLSDKPIISKVGILAFGIICFYSVGSDAQSGWIFAFLISVFTVAVAYFLLKVFYRIASYVTESKEKSAELMTNDLDLPGSDRRKFVQLSLGVVAASALAGFSAKAFRSFSSISEYRSTIKLRKPKDSKLPSLVLDAEANQINRIPGIKPVVVPNDDFYLIDTALIKPQVDPRDWSLTINGMVDQQVTYSYEDLLDRSTTTAAVTLSCVSNEVGGDLVGNAVWQGVPLKDLLEEAGVDPNATQIASRSVDGWTCGFPTEVAFDGRTALVAIGMNGEPLPKKNGFPARLVVSGLYGYVSATKWVEEITLTTLDAFDGYWIPRGWSKLGPVKTQSRIDTPRFGSNVSSGNVINIGGVAWAPNIGISKVEVNINDSGWNKAELGESLGIDAWVQWSYPFDVKSPGEYIVQVRATDESGYTQTEELKDIAPDGATGRHTILFNVT